MATQPVALLPLPPPPAYLPTLPADNHQYFLSSQLIPNPQKDVVATGLPASDRRTWPHLQEILRAFMDDKGRKLCWHMRTIVKLLCPANSDYPGRYLYVCHYYRTHPECDCRYRELDFHFERRYKNKQPLVATLDCIPFPAGHGPQWIPIKLIRFDTMRRIWRQPDTVEATERQRTNDGRDMLVVKRVPHDGQHPAPVQALPEVVQEIQDIQKRILSIRFNDHDHIQLFDHNEASKAIHKLVLDAGPPEPITADAIDTLLRDRVLNTQRTQQEYAAASRTNNEDNDGDEDEDEDEDDEDEPDPDGDPWEINRWNSHFHTLIKWFRTSDGLPFALPFLRECLDNNAIFGAVMQEQFDRLFGMLGRTPTGCSPARPEDNEKKSELLDRVYAFIASQHHEPIVHRFQSQSKRRFLRDLLYIKEVQEAYAVCQLPWKKLIAAANETIHLIESTQEAKDFDWTRLPPATYKRGLELVEEVSVLDSRDRTPWSGIGDSFAGFGWSSG
ncbi:hypothetical protein CALCODRAFT_481492 [Calocera cornea HHB12733]|uniref:Uncharacterized protein n=1 Tax=Calocera cornea HHB12733 TaxID=1353952 RepID=A0A165HQF6_9BASI|nr:hypothetical protein CALCODRAFT_481492 [Calocera cornea HHB12733]